MKLIITRHGETEFNKLGIIQGAEHGSISELGFRQIKNLIQRLKKEKVDRIISSDAKRCKITTEEIQKEINIPVEYSKLLQEKSYGDFTGKKADEVGWDSLEGDLVTKHAPNGENLIMVKERVKKFIELINKFKNTSETILIVSHGIFLSILIGYLLGMNLLDSRYKIIVDHCSLTEIDFDKKYKLGYRVLYLNEVSFLNDLID